MSARSLPRSRFKLREVRREIGLGREPRLETPRRDRVELAVEIGVEEQVALLAVVGHCPLLSISRRRARASRDMTVPMGRSSMAAISL